MTNSSHKLQQDIDQIRKEIQPSRDLWQGIELGIEHNHVHQEPSQLTRFLARQRLALAASVGFIAVLGWLLLQQSGVPFLEPQTASQQPSMVELAKVMSADHQLQKQSLLVTLQDQPALTENWHEQINELDEAADAIKAALQQDPNNAALLKMLQHVYQQQLSLIERVHSPKWRTI